MNRVNPLILCAMAGAFSPHGYLARKIVEDQTPDFEPPRPEPIRSHQHHLMDQGWPAPDAGILDNKMVFVIDPVTNYADSPPIRIKPPRVKVPRFKTAADIEAIAAAQAKRERKAAKRAGL